MTITRSDVLPMIEDWLYTPVNGFFGSPYGSDIASLLLRHQSDGAADQFIEKLKTDVPILRQLDSSQLALFSENEGFERKRIYLKVFDISIDLNVVSEQLQATSGGTFDVTAG